MLLEEKNYHEVKYIMKTITNKIQRKFKEECSEVHQIYQKKNVHVLNHLFTIIFKVYDLNY